MTRPPDATQEGGGGTLAEPPQAQVPKETPVLDSLVPQCTPHTYVKDPHVVSTFGEGLRPKLSGTLDSYPAGFPRQEVCGEEQGSPLG